MSLNASTPCIRCSTICDAASVSAGCGRHLIFDAQVDIFHPKVKQPSLEFSCRCRVLDSEGQKGNFVFETSCYYHVKLYHEFFFAESSEVRTTSTFVTQTAVIELWCIFLRRWSETLNYYIFPHCLCLNNSSCVFWVGIDELSC